LITRCPDFAVKELIDRQQLIQLLPYYDFGKGPIHVVYNYRKHLSSKVTTFTEALTRYLGEHNGH
jgi:DNA-binding transcriptional LysR family regulator